MIVAASAATKPVYAEAESNPRDTGLRCKHPTSQIVSDKTSATSPPTLDGRPPGARRSERGTHALCNVCKYAHYRRQSDVQRETMGGEAFYPPPPAPSYLPLPQGSSQSSRSETSTSWRTVLSWPSGVSETVHRQASLVLAQKTH